ncbi:hypothetical protein C8F04DRAFT_1274607, partial [Mycena alexandri]
HAALAAYIAAYDVVFKNKGNDYAIRHAAALPLLQAAEQVFHDFVVPFRAARGMGPRSESALEPLPGLQRVVTVLPAAAPLVRATALVPIAGPPPAQTPPSTPLGRRRYTQFPSLPSPPTSSADNSPSPASPPPTSSPARSSSAGPSSARNIIDLTHIDDDDEPRAPLRTSASSCTWAPSSSLTMRTRTLAHTRRRSLGIN